MKGNIQKRGTGRYLIKIGLGKDATDKYKYRWETVRGTKEDARQKLREMQKEHDTRGYVDPGKSTVAEYLNKWLEDYARLNLTPRTAERYAGIIKGHFAHDFGDIRLVQLKPQHLQAHYAAKLNSGLSARTVRYHHAILHVALKTAVKWGLLSRNPADAVDPPKIRPVEMRTWDEDEANRFLEAIRDTHYYELFYLALVTGMRRGELLALRWCDIDLLGLQLSVNRSLHHLKNGSYIFSEPKSAKSRRTIALSPAAAILLREYKLKREAQCTLLGIVLKDSDLVFSHVDGSPLRPNTITRAWPDMAVRAGVKVIRLHDARHTHASLMLKQGIHPKIVQERLGHASIQMTLDTYSHVAPGLQAAAAARFDELIAPRPKREAIKLAVGKLY
jgi:integrase